ncbi:hypothetical protein [Dyadobacter frigoris]|uniref:Uncharacterized protein n=1 Tax=Dyadobacter frigoris TaxID=2576211 RepID=A0A4U6CRA5_9BACT|nr:hypothetical protein FDK13_32910 [Dyadobacter frigoris]
MKYLPVFALVMGGGLALAENTFRPTVAPQYYFNGEAWQELGSIQPGTTTGTYRCQSSPTEQCTAETLIAGVPGGVTPGAFTINP